MMTRTVLNIRALLLALFISVSIGVFAQTSVKGVVLEPSGEPAIGATIMEKGTNAGTATDFDGNFAIKVASPNAVLVVSYVGMETQEVKLAGRTDVTITLKESGVALDEVVVVGYGTMKKSDLAGASVSMSEDDLKGSIITNLDQSLQGRATGVQAMTTSGAPGSSSSIRVRGQSTINANAEPLYVIDGVIVQGGGNSGADFGLGDALGNGKVSTVSPLSTINPSDIVSMEILKDASATAIYGAQGSNGVVLITTKRGKAGEAKFTYDGMVAVNHQNKRLDMMNLREYAGYYNEFVANGYQTANDWYRDPSVLGVGTNWQDAVFRTALQNQHQVSAQGGTEKVQYYVSGSYMNQEGTLIGSDFSRFSVRANLDAQLKSWLKLGLSATYTDTDESLKLADGEQGIINYSLTTLPDIPIYDIDGNFSSIVREGYTNPNPIALAMLDDIKLHRKKLTGNIFFDVTPIKNLVWHAEFGYDVSASKGDRYKPMVDLGSWVRSSNESSIQKNSSWFWQLKNYVSYNGTAWDKFHYTAMVGQECWESRYDFTSIFASGLPSDEVHNPALGNKNSYNISAGFGSSAMASFFTRETLNWDDRYLLTYTYRYDGSSNFGPENRWAGFHSVAGAWRFSNEKFFEPVRNVIDNGKLRLGWGQTGNSNIGGYAWGVAMSRMPSALGAGYRPANIANPAIKWETQEQWNAGIDLNMLNNRLNLVVDAYIKTSKDMLMSMQLPSYMGTQGNGSSALAAPKGNFGEIENKGIEIELTGRPFVGEFEWESSFQISFNRNKLKALSGTENAQLVGYGQWSDVVSVSEIGQPLYNFYGYVVEGVYRDYDDIMNSPTPDHFPSDGVFNKSNTVWVGDIKYKDVNGDGKIDANDRTVIGSPMPKFTFGWTNTFRYKNIDLSIFLNGSYGNDVMNYLAINLTGMKSVWTNQLNSVNDRAQLVPIDPNKVYPAGQHWYDDITNVRVKNWQTKTPAARLNDPNDNDRISDRYIEDGSYLRIKNITLGYTFKKSLLKRLHLENLRVYCNIQNLYTFTKYKGYDPEIGASTQDSSGLVYGLDFGRYPSPTTYSFGLNISF
ncbi:MAG: TonB-dependent receptor [Muribaculum sp.]|nr:TonB-dependent receptor [Muribaculum sp.]